MVRDNHVVDRRHVPEDRRLLEGADDPLASDVMGRHRGDVLAPIDDLSGRSVEEGRYQLEERALPRAVGADKI